MSAKASANESKSGSTSVGQLILALMLTTLAGVLCGIGLSWYQGAGTARAVTETAAVTPAKEKNAPTEPVIRHLQPIVTNLSRPADIWVRMEASVLVNDPAIPETLIQSITADATALIRSVTLTQIGGAYGLNYLREDLKEKLATRSEGKVTDIFIRSLVVQ